MPRVIADVDSLTAYAQRVAGLDTGRRRQLRTLDATIEHFLNPGSAYAPEASGVASRLSGLFDDTVVDAYGVMATAAAFRDAEVHMAAAPFGSWYPDDAWLERQRRAWLLEFQPRAIRAAAPALDPAAVIRRVREIDAAIAAQRGSSYLSLPTIERLLAERNGLLVDGLVYVDAVTDSIHAWWGSDNDPLLDQLLAQRSAMVGFVVGEDPVAAARMTVLINDGHHAAPSWLRAIEERAYESRLGAVMHATGADRSGALDVIEAMDRDIAGVITAGHTAESAVMAFAIADHLDLDLRLAAERSQGSGIGIVDVLGRMAAARALDVDYESLIALEQFRAHFDTFDNATGGDVDGAVSERDLFHVVDNPTVFLPAQVLAAQAILDEPLLRNRLDSATENTDVLDGDSFGRTEPGDLIISAADFDAFLVRAQLNNLLGDYADQIDTAGSGGDVDGFFSENDLQAWLAANPGAPVAVRDGLALMLRDGLVDESWLERNRDALAMGATVAAGGVVIVISGGTLTPVVWAAGFAAGGAAAGATTLGVNHATSDGLTEGMFSNMVGGGLIGVSVVGLPTTWTNATAIAGGLTVQRTLAMAGFAGEVASVVGAGGVDLLLPDDWEDEVHDAADAVEFGASLLGGFDDAGRGATGIEPASP